jgi:hypothetical protein
MPLRKVHNLRAVKPGEWVRTRIPDYECWQEKGGWTCARSGAEVEACVCPIRAPLYESTNGFRWTYHAAIRRIGSTSHCFVLPKGCPIRPYDLAMVEGTSQPFGDKDEYGRFLDGQGTWLYEPSCDDPELCPGADCSKYLCDTCGEYRMPWSDDEGQLVCGQCEVSGLVIDERQVERLEQVRDFARQMGLSQQLNRQLNFLDKGTSFGKRSQCILGGDFAPHSFSFGHYILPESAGEKRRPGLHGGLIYQGPTSPADGSFPSCTVSLARGNGWFCHT